MDFQSYKTKFASLVQKHFAYLITDYGFTFGEVSSWNISIMVSFTSSFCTVGVHCEGANTDVSIHPASLPLGCSSYTTKALSFIIPFKDGVTPPAKLPLLTRPFDEPSFYEDRLGNLDRDLAKWANLLPQYCDDMLRGDFSILLEYERWVWEYAGAK